MSTYTSVDSASVILGIIAITLAVLVGLLVIAVRRIEPLVDRLEQASADNRAAALTFRSAIGALVLQSDETGASLIRIERHSADVAVNLEKSQQLANEVPIDSEPGVASDAASRGEYDNGT